MPTKWELQGALIDLGDLGHYSGLGLPSVRRLLACHAADDEVREECIWTIRLLDGHVSCQPLLIRLIREDPSTRVRQIAIAALDEYPSTGPGSGPAALDVFLHALKDPDAHVRFLAVRGLRDSGPAEPRVIAALQQTLAEESDRDVRLYTEQALARMHTVASPAR